MEERRNLPPTPAIITDKTAKSVLRMQEAIPAVEAVLAELSAGQAKNMIRIGMETEMGIFRFMAAYSPSLKLAGVNQGFWSSGFKGDKAKAKSSGILSLYDTSKAELRAVVMAPSFNEIRVGAITGVAAKHLSNPAAKKVGLIGSSNQARTQLLGLSEVRAIEEVKVYSRNQRNRERFCKEMSKEVEAKLSPVESATEATRDAEIVLEATDADEPVIDGRNLSEGCYVSSIKTGRHGSRQLDDETVRRANLFAIDFKEQAIADGAGDVVLPIAKGILDWNKIVELGDIISKKIPGRKKESDLVVFKSCGMAIADLAIAALLLDATP